MSTVVYLALGGNQGDVPATLKAACDELAAHPEISRLYCSGLYTTQPVGIDAGQAFINAAVRCETTLAPEELLTLCQQVEAGAGRVRFVHWGPRTLDIDIVGYGDLICQTPRLTLPHPAAWYRRFVLDPLCQIAADWIHPERACSVSLLRDRLLQRPLILDVSAAPPALARIASELEVSFSSEQLQIHYTKHPQATWQLIDPLDRPEDWKQANSANRLSSRQWTEMTRQDFIDLVRSALDEPRPII